MSSLKEKMLDALRVYGKPMTYQGWTGAFFEDYSKFEINEALNQLLDDKVVIRHVDRKYITQSTIDSATEKVINVLKEGGPDKIQNVIDKVVLEAKEAALYREIFLRLLDSGRVEITVDWKVRARVV